MGSICPYMRPICPYYGTMNAIYSFGSPIWSPPWRQERHGPRTSTDRPEPPEVGMPSQPGSGLRGASIPLPWLRHKADQRGAKPGTRITISIGNTKELRCQGPISGTSNWPSEARLTPDSKNFGRPRLKNWSARIKKIVRLGEKIWPARKKILVGSDFFSEPARIFF